MNSLPLCAGVLLALFAGCSGKTLQKDGGAILVYELAQESKTPAATRVEAMPQRLNHLVPPGQLEVKELDYGKFEVTLIGVSDEELQTAKGLLRTNGELEFRIVALRGEDDELIAGAEEDKPVKD